MQTIMLPFMKTLISRSEAGRVRGPQWATWLSHLIDHPNYGLELGTFQGDSAQWMLDNVFTHPDSRYYCVDTFEGSVEHHIGGIDCTSNEAITRAKLAEYGVRAQIHKSLSHYFMRDCPVLFDFVYVDAAHDSMNVLRDAVLAFDLLVDGGIMVFDDYEWKVMPNSIDCPKMAIDSFVNCYRNRIKILNPIGWQYAIRKIE